jgi:hypothetical protein
MSSGAGPMSALSRVRPDEFTIAMLATVMFAFLLPCRGTSAEIFGDLAGCTWSFLPPALCCFQSSDSLCGRYPRSC